MDDPRLDAVAAPELRAALLFVRSRPDPVSADDLAAAGRIHRNVARARLERLAEAGLLTTSFARRTGRAGPGAGRPAKLYAAAPETRSIEFPDRRLADLVALVAEDLPAAGARRAGEAFGRLLAVEAGLEPAAAVGPGLERLCAAVGGLGFQASVVEVDEAHAVVATPTCPLRPLVVGHPEAAVIDAGMWAALLERSVAGVEAGAAGCATDGCLDGRGACRVTFQLSKNL